MNDFSWVIEQLRSPPSGKPYSILLGQAADALTALQRRLETAQATIKELNRQIAVHDDVLMAPLFDRAEAAEARVAELEHALSVLAAMGEK